MDKNPRMFSIFRGSWKATLDTVSYSEVVALCIFLSSSGGILAVLTGIYKVAKYSFRMLMGHRMLAMQQASYNMSLYQRSLESNLAYCIGLILLDPSILL